MEMTTAPNSNAGLDLRVTRSPIQDPSTDGTSNTPSISLSAPPSTNRDPIDVSHVPLQPPKSPMSSLSFRFGEASSKLAETLRMSSPLSPSRSFKSFGRSPSGVYEAVSPSESSSKMEARKSMKSFTNSIKGRSLISNRNDPMIEESEEIDMGLLKSAAKFGEGGTGHTSTIHEEEDDNEMIGYDISSLTFGGPSYYQQDELAKSPFLASPSILEEARRMEAEGTLTGGLGVAISPPEIPSSELEAKAPTPMLSRGLTLLGRPSRNPTLKALGQSLADKRGEAIKVVIEEEFDSPPVDLSSFAGEGSSTYVFSGSNRKSTLVSSGTMPKTEIFYPTANWKPFSMRWPYLTALILISITLAIAQEYIYQHSLNGGLYSFKKPQDLATWSYFSFKYLPTVIAVTFGVLWQFTDNEVKRLEVYYQLSTPSGAFAAESINVDYITFINLLRPIRALRYKHMAVFESSLATLLAATLVPPLQAASVVLDPPLAQRLADPDGMKFIHISAVWSRFLTVILIIIALLGCFLLWRLQRRHSGLMADVHGIAGIAAMANKSHILVDFKNMDVASPDDIHKKLRNRRYELRDSSLRPNDNYKITDEEIHKYDQFKKVANPHPMMLRLNAGVPFVCYMLFCLLFLPIVLFTKASVITDNVSWIITLLAVVIKLIWSSLETDMRMLEPFYTLSKRHAPPSVLTMDYTGVAWGWMPIKAFISGNFLLCLVGVGSILSEILTVSVTSFTGVNGNDFVIPPPSHPEGGIGRRDSTSSGSSMDRDAGEETFTSFWVSFGLAITILVFLICIATLVYARRRHPFLPRQPNTIASVLAFIHQSNMLYDFVDTQKLDFDGMVDMLNGLKGRDGEGKMYGLGWFVGRDGETHCGIDEEELIRGYKHGSDIRAAVQTGGVGSWAVF